MWLLVEAGNQKSGTDISILLVPSDVAQTLPSLSILGHPLHILCVVKSHKFSFLE